MAITSHFRAAARQHLALFLRALMGGLGYQ
jgi:hypothetical protein